MKHLSPKINVGLVINPSIYVRENGVPFLYGGNIIPRGFSLVNVRYMSEEDSIMLHQSRLLEGDLVTVRVGEPGITAVIPSHMEGANCASVIITRSCKSFDSHWLCNVMNSPVVSTQIDLVKYGSAQKQFNIAHAIEFTVPVPPLEEQKQISEFIHSKNRLIDKMKTSISEKINHLNEYRTALISAAVTGKIDLRGL